MFILPLEDPILIVALLFVIILLVPYVARLLQLPSMVLLIVVGMLVGTHVLGVLQRDSQLVLLEKMGLLYIMLLAGIQMDLSDVKRLGMRSLIFGILTFIIPFVAGYFAGQLIGLSVIASCMIGLILSPHVLIAYPTIARLGLAQKEFIGVTVGATAITAFLTLAVFSMLRGSVMGTLGLIFWAKLLLGLPILVGLSAWLVPKLGQWVFNDPHTSVLKQFVFVLTTLFVLSGLTTLVEIDSIVGAFLAGLVLNPLVPLKSKLMEQVEFVGNGLFIPCFMISVGVLCDPRVFIANPGIISVTLFIFSVSLGSKAIPAMIVTPLFNYSRAEGLTIFSLTMARAALVVVIALFGQKYDLISLELFNVSIAYILLSCMAGTLMTEWSAPKLSTASR